MAATSDPQKEEAPQKEEEAPQKQEAPQQEEAPRKEEAWFIVLDTECTGLSVISDEIFDIGCCLLSESGAKAQDFQGYCKPTKQISDEAMCQMQAYRICLAENYGIQVDRFLALYAFPDQPAVPVAAGGPELERHESHWTQRIQAFSLLNP